MAMKGGPRGALLLNYRGILGSCHLVELAANPIVIEAYLHTGKIILYRQSEDAWGAKVIDRLAADLREEFPDMGGLSARNLQAMKIFGCESPEGQIAQQPVARTNPSGTGWAQRGRCEPILS